MLTSESIFRDLSRLAVWYPLRWVINAFPIEKAFRVFDMMGSVHSCVSSAKKQIIIKNFIALANAGVIKADKINPEHAARRYFQMHYKHQLLVFLFPKLNRKNIPRIHEFEGLEKIDREIKKGNGCILLHGHYGPIHLPLFHLGLENYNVKQLGYLRKPEGLSKIGDSVSYRLRAKLEKLIPAEIIQANEFLRPAFLHLKNSGILMMTGDGTGWGQFVGQFAPAHFLGTRVLFPLGPAKLATKSGACIFPMITLATDRPYFFRTMIGDPLISGKELTRIAHTSPAETFHSAAIAGQNRFARSRSVSTRHRPVKPVLTHTDDTLNRSCSENSDQCRLTEGFAAFFEGYVKKQLYNWSFWDEFAAGDMSPDRRKNQAGN